MTPPRMAIATNNGDMGGGEVMLLNIAGALRTLGIEPLVIGPREPGELVAASRALGFETVALHASGRPAYMAALMAWRLRHMNIPLWCNGLVPSTATAGLGPRLTHLHIIPEGPNRLASAFAHIGARRTLVPSRFMAVSIPGTTVLENWTREIPFTDRKEPMPADRPVRIGFLGRLIRDKGVDVLARATALLIAEGHDVELVLAGENRFGSAEDDRALARALEEIEDRTTRLGWTDRETFFDAVDLAVFPSVFPEPFGLVAAEAMASGTPFVISDAGGLPEVAGPHHPWIAQTGDARDLADVIASALPVLADAERRTALLRASRRRWESCYAPKQGVQRVAALLAGLDQGEGQRL